MSREHLHDDSDQTDSFSEHACMQAQESHYTMTLHLSVDIQNTQTMPVMTVQDIQELFIS